MRDAPLPILPAVDPVDRDVTYMPSKSSAEDPRQLLTGVEEQLLINDIFAPGQFPMSAAGAEYYPPVRETLTGLVDRGSFDEILGGWAPSTIVGRARLGGIPIGSLLCLR